MDAFSAGAWRFPHRGEGVGGGAWRRLTRGEEYAGGQWRAIVTFVPPLSLAANDTDGQASSSKPTLVVSGTSQATPTGGLAPFTYAWSITAGSAVIASPTSAATSFRRVVTPGETVSVTAQCVCTDSLGSTATKQITIEFTNVGGL